MLVEVLFGELDGRVLGGMQFGVLVEVLFNDDVDSLMLVHQPRTTPRYISSKTRQRPRRHDDTNSIMMKRTSS